MAGKIVADTLEHSTAGSVDTQYVVNGSAKVLGNLQPDGSSNSDISLNISSVTDGSTGLNTVAVSNAFAAALAVSALISNHDSSYNRGLAVDDTSASSFVTRSFGTSNGTLMDTDTAHSIAFFGDLA